MKTKAPILPPKIPMPIKPLLQAIESAVDLASNNPGKNTPEVLDERAHLRKIHGELKVLRSNLPADCVDQIWVLSLVKVLDETLDIYFKKVDNA